MVYKGLIRTYMKRVMASGVMRVSCIYRVTRNDFYHYESPHIRTSYTSNEDL